MSFAFWQKGLRLCRQSAFILAVAKGHEIATDISKTEI
jgi:hypothetical protein